MLRSRFPCGAVSLARNTAYDAGVATIMDRAYTQPPVWSDVDLETGAAEDVLRREAPGHDPAAYVTERRSFAAPDGTPVGATVVRHRDTPLDGTAPALLYGYGAYEAVDEAEWDPALPSLLDRGVVWVHAHIRGGGEGGRRWWLDGRLEHKQHTFDDHRRRRRRPGGAGRRVAARVARAERRRAAPGRGVQPAAGPVAGGAWPRSRSWTWSAPCSTRRSR